MPVEIERKFLVRSDAWRETADAGRRFCQGYISKGSLSRVRVRHAADKAYLTVKGPRVGITRAEFEYEIPVEDAEDLLPVALCEAVTRENALLCHLR